MARKKELKKNGRPPIVIDPVDLEKLGALHPTYAEIAAFYGCTERTIINRLKEPELQLALETGKGKGKLNLRRLQLRHANGTGSGASNMAQHLGKHWLGQTDRSLIEMSGKDGADLTVTHKIEITMTLPAPKTDDEDRSYRDAPVLAFQPKIVSGKD